MAVGMLRREFFGAPRVGVIAHLESPNIGFPRSLSELTSGGMYRSRRFHLEDGIFCDKIFKQIINDWLSPLETN